MCVRISQFRLLETNNVSRGVYLSAGEYRKGPEEMGCAGCTGGAGGAGVTTTGFETVVERPLTEDRGSGAYRGARSFIWTASGRGSWTARVYGYWGGGPRDIAHASLQKNPFRGYWTIEMTVLTDKSE